MSKNIFRQAGILLIASSVFLVIAADRFFIASAEIKSFPGYLLEASRDDISSFSPSLASRIFFRNETRANMAAIQAVSGTGDPGGESISPSMREHLSQSLPITLLMYRALSASDFVACRSLAGLWAGSPAGLFAGAVLLEEGSAAGSREVWETLPTADQNSWLGKRILRQLLLAETDEGNPVLPVFDRRGIPLGDYRNGELAIIPDYIDVHLPGRAMAESIKGELVRPLRGVRTSIDLEIQEAARDALEGYRGSIVIMDPHTGEILAAVSDPRTLRGDDSAPFRQQYEPASISKLFTTSAALRAGMDVDEFMADIICSGGKRYSGEILWCSFRSGRLESMARAMSHSCNIGFADLGIAAGRKAVIDELQIFGFDRPVSGPFHFGKIIGRTGNDRQLADLSIGLEETTITPLHGALAAAVFANGGIMPEPGLISAYDGFLGLSPREASRPPGSWIITDQDHLHIIESAMREVADNGTGRGLSHDGFSVALKTGTGRTAGTGYVTNYIGFGPLPDPSISFCVRVTHQSTSSRVRRATREVMSRLLEKLPEQGAFPH